MIRLFTGYDEREAVGWHVFLQSLMATTKEMVSIHALSGKQRDGTNAFTYERFMIPSYCDYKGWAIFMDGSDMLLRDDIAALWKYRDLDHAVHVVKHEYRTKSKQKYIGTPMQAANVDYPRKNWSSVILWNCQHSSNAHLDREFVEDSTGEYLHRFGWLDDHKIGTLPPKWNVLVGEQHLSEADAVRHFTLGIPSFKHYAKCDGAEDWHAIRNKWNT